jgi:transcriptional regulator with XRE-family HTH domain
MACILALPVKRQQFSDRLLSWRLHFSSSDYFVATSAGFAKLLMLDQTTYEDIENGGMEPSLGFFQILRERTGVSLDWLIEGR